MEIKPKKLKVAAIQMESKNGNISYNLDKASEFVNEASNNKVKLVLLPELMPSGYIFSNEIWNSAEPKNGLTVKWLKSLSAKYKIWLGTSFLEADKGDFYNTFVLTNPSGEEAGRVRKQTSAGFEAYYIKGEKGMHVIDSEFGKIGVGICYENQLSYLPKLMSDQSVDIYIMPHSAPTPMQNIFFPKRSIELFVKNYRILAVYFSEILGIPTILSNKCGKFKSPLPGTPFIQETEFMGYSTIVDSDRTVKAQMRYEEGIIINDVILDPARKTKNIPKMSGRWSWNVPLVLNMMRMTEAQGKLYYNLNIFRKKKSLRISNMKR